MNAAHWPSCCGLRGAGVSVTSGPDSGCGGRVIRSVRNSVRRGRVVREDVRWRGFGGFELSARLWPALGERSRVRHRELRVSTNWRDVDIAELRALLTGTVQNCDQFPKLNPDGSIAEVCPVKLERAIRHSFIVVAMYVRGELEEDYFVDRREDDDVPPRLKRSLVAFGRVTSDHALTASIHDLAVAPSLQGQGIGRRLVQRIVREISRHGIADISVMASRKTRPFFRACGFGSDILGSTSMMYTAAEDCSDCSESSMLVVPPPLRESWALSAAEAPRTVQVVNNVASA